MGSKEWPELFSLGIHATENLRVEVLTTLYGVRRKCTTGLIEVDGHKVIDFQEYRELVGTCRGFRLNLNNTMVRVIPSVGYEWASTPANAQKIDIGVDLTLAPTVTCELLSGHPGINNKYKRMIIFQSYLKLMTSKNIWMRTIFTAELW